MTALHGETVHDIIEETVDHEKAAHMSRFAIDLLTPYGGDETVPADLYPEQIRQFVANAGELTVDNS